MVLQVWDPFRHFGRLEGTMARLRRDVAVPGEIRPWAVPLDVVQEDDSFVVRASLPGVKPDEIQVTIEDGVLTIKSETETENEEQNGNFLVRERRTGRFHRRLRLPDTIDVDKAETGYEHGVLKITFPKIEAKKARRLDIKVAA